MSRTLTGVALIVIAVALGLAFFTGQLGQFTSELQSRVSGARTGRDAVPFPKRFARAQ